MLLGDDIPLDFSSLLLVELEDMPLLSEAFENVYFIDGWWLTALSKVDLCVCSSSEIDVSREGRFWEVPRPVATASS